MTARLARRWRRWRVRSRLITQHVNTGYKLTPYHEALYRAEAERRVP